MSEDLEKQINDIGKLDKAHQEDGGSTLIIPEDMASGFHPQQEKVDEAARHVDEVRKADPKAIRQYLKRTEELSPTEDNPMILLSDEETREAVEGKNMAAFFDPR